MEVATRSLTPSEMVRADGPTDPSWQALGRRNNPGGARGSGPVLIVHSDEDEVVPAELSRLLHDRMCAHGQVVERRVIHAGGHTRAVLQAYLAGAAWLQQRARGVKPVDDCPNGSESIRG